MKSGLPKIKKELSAFLVGEEGKISKQYIVTIGALLATSALLARDVKPVHSGEISGGWTLGDSGGTVAGSHTHHASHSSY